MRAPATAKNAYKIAHDRVKRLRGSATGYKCQTCDVFAEHWAYDHGDPAERRVTALCFGRLKLMPISDDPAHYLALCKECHAYLDRTGELPRTPAPLRSKRGPVTAKDIDQIRRTLERKRTEGKCAWPRCRDTRGDDGYCACHSDAARRVAESYVVRR